MTEEKKGIWARIFGAKKSSCCNMRIEEVSEEGSQDAKANQSEDKSQTQGAAGKTKVAKPKNGLVSLLKESMAKASEGCGPGCGCHATGEKRSKPDA